MQPLYSVPHNHGAVLCAVQILLREIKESTGIPIAVNDPAAAVAEPVAVVAGVVAVAEGVAVIPGA